MDKLYLVGVVILLIYFLMNKNIENFSLNFPENGLKCKCDMDNENELDDSKDTVMSLENNTIEKFTNYDTSTINTTKKLDNRVYNIYDSPYDESANSYYEKKYYYPIKPLKNGFKFEGSNSDKYKNIGTSSNKLLSDYDNNNIESYNYIFGINYENNDNEN